MLQINQQTMSSREISNLVESRHDTVKLSMARLSDKGLITITPLAEPTAGGGKLTEVYLVNKRDSYVVVAQLSPEFTARLVDRWQELENQQQPKLPTDYLSALEHLVVAVKENTRLEAINNKLMHVDKRTSQGTRFNICNRFKCAFK